MPAIVQYESPIDSLTPSNLGPAALEQEARLQRVDYNEAGTAVGSGIAAAGNQYVAQVAKHQAFDELLTGGRLAANLLLNLSTQADEYAKAHPNDPAAQKDFLDNTVEPALAKFQEGFNTPGGRNYGLQQADMIRSHLFNKTSAILSTQAMDNVVSTTGETANTFATAASEHPEDLDATLVMQKQQLDAIAKDGNSNMSADDASKINTTYAAEKLNGTTVAGLTARAYANPQKFLDDQAAGKLDKYSQYLKAGEFEQLTRIAQEKLKSDASDAASGARAQKAADDAAFDKAAVTQAAGMAIKAPDGTVSYKNTWDMVYGASPDALIHQPGVTPEKLRAAKAAYDATNKQAAGGTPVVDDPAVWSDLMTRARMPSNAPNALSNYDVDLAVSNKYISGKSGVELKALVRDRDPTKAVDEKYYDAVLKDIAKPMIWPNAASSGAPPAVSSAQGQRWIQFQQDFRTVYEAKRGQGLSAQDLLNPGSKDYIFNTFRIKDYIIDPLSTDYGVTSPKTIIPPVGESFPTQKQLDPTARTAVEGYTNANTSLTNFLSGADFGQAPGDPVQAPDTFTGSAATGNTAPPSADDRAAQLRAATGADNSAPAVVYKPGMSMDDLANQVK